MTSYHFHWSKLIAGISNESFGIPADVTFQIVDESGAKRSLQEVRAHKMILAMVSDIFKTMFYSTNVGNKTVDIVKIEKTTAPAFRIMIDAVYNIKSIGDSLKGKSVDEVFDVMILVDRYHIGELMEAVKQHLANFPIADATVLEVAGEAMEYNNMFETDVKLLLFRCANILKNKLKDANSVFRYVAENKGDVLNTLVDIINDIIPTECYNCGKEVCQDGEEVKEDEFRVGLVVKQNNLAVDYFGDEDYGTGRVINVEDDRVNIECIKPGHDDWKFNATDDDPKTTLNDIPELPDFHNPIPTFLFSCE